MEYVDTDDVEVKLNACVERDARRRELGFEEFLRVSPSSRSSTSLVSCESEVLSTSIHLSSRTQTSRPRRKSRRPSNTKSDAYRLGSVLLGCRDGIYEIDELNSNGGDSDDHRGRRDLGIVQIDERRRLWPSEEGRSLVVGIHVEVGLGHSGPYDGRGTAEEDRAGSSNLGNPEIRSHRVSLDVEELLVVGTVALCG